MAGAVETCGTDGTWGAPRACIYTQTCQGGACVACPDGYIDCDGTPVTQCETNLRAATTCGTTCGDRHACTDGATCFLGTCFPAPSCDALATTCGASGDGSCCASPLVKGGTFKRSYDGVTWNDPTYPATVSNFRLDKYEVTVGRFRQFVDAWDGGFRPFAGDGKHGHLNGGKGLALAAGGFEPGWDAGWAGNVATSAAGWDANLTNGTWTSTPGGNEDVPITRVTWYEAAAFCIWDHGFLPSEAEWNYAASGGSEQRVYPWSNPPTSTDIDCSYANFLGGAGGTDFCVLPGKGATSNVGSMGPKGDGKYGHSDLTGNVWEWVLDWYVTPYSVPCVDCAETVGGANRGIRGGGFGNLAQDIESASRNGSVFPTERYGNVGARCARTP